MDKTWAIFVIFFADAHQEWHKSHTTTSSSTLYVNQEYQHDTIDVIDNLVTFTAHDHESGITLAMIVDTLTTEL